MNKIEKLISELPGLCGAKASWARSGVLQYHDELEHPEHYERIPGELFEERCESYASFVDHCKDRDKAFYGLGLLAVVDANHKGNEVEASALKDQLRSLAGHFPDVDEIMTFDEAAALDFWN
jgi:hypothetical protein